jgi:hypothetical protein
VAVVLELFDDGGFVAGEESGVEFLNAGDGGDGLGGFLAVAGEHEGVEA